MSKGRFENKSDRNKKCKCDHTENGISKYIVLRQEKKVLFYAFTICSEQWRIIYNCSEKVW